MTRLTNNIRKSILGKLIHRAFKERGDEMIKRNADFARRVYEDAFAKDLKLINSLPKGWLVTASYVYVRLGATVTHIYFSGTLNSYQVHEYLRMAGVDRLDVPELPFPNNRRGVPVIYPADHKLSEEYQTLREEMDDLSQEIDRACRMAKATLDSVASIKKLIEVWPEVEEIAKPYLINGERKAVLPAIPRAQLNTILDLPPEGTVA